MELSSSRQSVLLPLTELDRLPFSEIAEQFKLGNSSLIGLIDRMRANGLVHQRHSAKDARVRNVDLEGEGPHRLILVGVVSNPDVDSSVRAAIESYCGDNTAIEAIPRVIYFVAFQAIERASTGDAH